MNAPMEMVLPIQFSAHHKCFYLLSLNPIITFLIFFAIGLFLGDAMQLDVDTPTIFLY